MKPCLICGSEFLATPRKKYCSIPCRRLAWRTAHPQKAADADRVARANRIKRARTFGYELSTVDSFRHTDIIGPKSTSWWRSFSFPFTFDLSKNSRLGYGANGVRFIRKDARHAIDALALVARRALAGVPIRQNKLWVEMLVEKPNMKGDAINLVDTVADVLKEVTGLDDRWYCLKGVDWRINRKNPCVIIRVMQEECEDVQVCFYCGRLLPFSMYTKNASKKSGLSGGCKDCMSRKVSAPVQARTKGEETVILHVEEVA